MHWRLKNLFRSFASARSRTCRNRKIPFRPGLETLEVRINPSNVDVLTWHNDNTLSGLNNQETVLNPSNVSASNSGKLFSYALDGYVYAQPLYKADLAIAGGTHNVAFVATEHDSVYALDTDAKPPPYWQTNLILPRAGFTVTTVPSGDTGSGDIVPEVGITGTPLVDAGTSTLYVLAKTKEVETATDIPHYVQRLYALDIHTGSILNSVVIGDTTGNGDTNVADNATNIIVTSANTGRTGDINGPTGPGAQNGEFRFNAFRENQRGAIALAPPDPLHPHGLLYLDFASHGDNGNYRGWVIGYDPTDLSLQQQFLTSLDDRAVGIWQSGAPVVVEARPDGFNDLFFSTGNGFGVTAQQVGPRNLTESVARIGTDSNPASPTYGQLIYEDSFTPFNWAGLDSGDTDLGSGGTMALPDSAGSPQHLHLLVETGKQGRIYLLDRDMLGGLSPDLATEQAAVVQEVDTQITGVWGSPAYFNGRIYYHGSGDVLVSLPVANAHIDASGIQRSNFHYNFPGAQPSISADGTSNGIVWELQTDNYNDTTAHEVLRAFDASNLQTLLYASDQSGARDQLSNSVKFVVPTITNGHVLIGSARQFSVFGLFPSDAQVPEAPTNLTATANSSSQITLTWDPLALTGGGEARQIDVERSIDGLTFTQIVVVSRDATSYVDSGLASNTHYFYQIRAENTLGASGYSNQANATTLLAPTVVSVLNILNTEVDLTWTAVSAADLGYTVQRSADGGLTWQTAGSVSAGGTFFADTGLSHQSYQYRVLANASSGQTSTSNVVSADLSVTTGVNFGAGFSTATGLTFNGSAARVVEPGWAQLTDGGQNEASTIFTTTRVGISTFQTSFTYRMHDGTDPRSDGMTFIIQGNSPTAIDSAGGGGGLAYGPDSPTGALGILNSIAIKFDLFNNAGEGTNSTGIFTGGRSPTVRQPGLDPRFPDMSIDLSAAPYLDAFGNPIININDQHLKQVDLSYDGTTLTEMITDLQVDPHPFVTIRYTVDIAALVGSNTAFVGFGGATGGTTVVQEVRTWTYAGTTSGVATPTNLAANPRTYSSTGYVKLTWSELSPVVTGFQLERSTDQTNWTRLNGGADLPFNDTTYIDAPPQPGTYYYRVRAVSDQATSNFTNSGAVAVLVPAAPSNLVAQQTSPTQINLSWHNNDLSMSATSIRVERSDGNPNNFVAIATLEDPSATSYSDTTFQAPNAFFYRVFAINANGDSLPTNVATLTALLVPAAPGSLTGFQNTTEVDLHWSNSPPPIATGIRIERSVGDLNHFVTIATPGVVTSYADTAVMAPNIYFYRVIASDAYGDSDPSNTISVSVQLVAGPLAYWQFDETSGTTAADATGHGNTGTLVGITDGTMEHFPGQFGAALHFEDHLPDGTVLQTNDPRLPVVTVPDAPDLNPTNAITLEAWINADTWGGTTSNNHRILQKGLNDNQYRFTDENGVLKFDLFIGTLMDVQTTLPSTGVWHHVVGTYDGTTMKLYVDAVLEAQLAISGAIAVTTDPLRIGSKDIGGTAGNHFVGTLDEVRIYGRALTQDEITFQQSWVDQDIGNVKLPGSVAVSGGAYTMRAAGAAIGGAADAFHYMYQPLNGDGSITARVVSIDGQNPFAGLMIRQSLDPSSANVALGLTPSGLSMQYRADSGGDTTTGGSDPAAMAGYWIRLVRQGNVFTAFDSVDGVTWTQVGDPIVVDMTSNVFIGLALTGNDDPQLATAVFDNVVVA